MRLHRASGLLQVMGRQQHGVALLVQARDELPQCLAQFHIDTRGGFVQDDDRRLVHQRLSHKHAPLHAAGELAHVGIRLVGQAQAFQQLI